MDETRAAAHAAEAGPTDADQGEPAPEPPACSPGAALQRAEAEPEDGDDGWVSL